MSEEQVLVEGLPDLVTIPPAQTPGFRTIVNSLIILASDPAYFHYRQTGVKSVDKHAIRQLVQKQQGLAKQFRKALTNFTSESEASPDVLSSIDSLLVSQAAFTLMNADGIHISVALWASVGKVAQALGCPDVADVCELHFIGEHARQLAIHPNRANEPERPKPHQFIDQLDALSPRLTSPAHVELVSLIRKNLQHAMANRTTKLPPHLERHPNQHRNNPIVPNIGK